MSLDKGKTTIQTNDKEIMSLYFFMHEFRYEHSRKVYNIIDILSEIGGLGTSLVSFVGVFGTMYNSYRFASHIIYLLYFVKSNMDKDDEEIEFEDEDDKEEFVE